MDIFIQPHCGTESEITNTKLKMSLSSGNDGNEWGDGGEEVMGGGKRKKSSAHCFIRFLKETVSASQSKPPFSCIITFSW